MTVSKAVLVALYKHLTAKQNLNFISIADAYNIVRTENADATQLICNEYAKNGKSERYANLKNSLLPVVTFSLNGESRNNKKLPLDKAELHTGLINLDIDEGTPGDLKKALAAVRNLFFIDAAGLSVSGSVNGHFWANIRVEIPPTMDKMLQGIFKHCNSKTWVNDLHKLYYYAAKYLIEQAAGVQCVGSSNDFKRCRLLAHDPDIFVNDAPGVITMEMLATLLNDGKIVQRKEQKQARKEQKQPRKEITGSYAQDYNLDNETLNRALNLAVEHAHRKGFDYIDGQKHSFRLYLAQKLNLLGVSEYDADSLITFNYPSSTGKYNGAISDTYKNFFSSHGTQNYLLNTFNYTLSKGQTLSDYTKLITDAILTYKKLIIKAPTGTGKTTAVTKSIADNLIKKGFVCVFVEPTNILTEQTAKGLDIEPLNASNFNDTNFIYSLLEQGKIVVNYANFERLAMFLISKNIDFIPFVDECHELENGVNFKDYFESHKIDKVLKTLPYSVLYSATPTEYKTLLGYKLLTFEQPDRSKITLIPKSYKGRATAAIVQWIKDNAGKGKILLIRINSKDKINAIMKALKSHFFKSEILCIYSDDKVKNTDAFKRLSDGLKGQNSFKNDVKIVLTTSLIDCGVSIYEAEKEVISAFFTGYTHDLKAVTQFADRHRTDKEKTIFYFYNDCKLLELLEQAKKDGNEDTAFYFSQKIELRKKDFDHKKRFLQELKRVQGRADYNNMELKVYDREPSRTDFIEDKTQYFDRQTNRYEVSEIGIAAKVEQEFLTNTTFEKFCNLLPTHFQVERTQPTATPTNETKKEVKHAVKEQKEVQKQFDSELKEVLESENKNAFIATAKFKSRKGKTAHPEVIRATEQKYKRLFDDDLDRCVLVSSRLVDLLAMGVKQSDAIGLVFDHQKTYSCHFHRVLGRFLIETTNENLTVPERRAKKQVTHILDYCREQTSKGSFFTVKVCREYINRIMETESGKKYLCSFSNFEILQFAQSFFELKKHRDTRYILTEKKNFFENVESVGTVGLQV